MDLKCLLLTCLIVLVFYTLNAHDSTSAFDDQIKFIAYIIENIGLSLYSKI